MNLHHLLKTSFNIFSSVATSSLQKKSATNILKAATVVVAFLIVCMGTAAYAGKTESYKDIIEKSYNLSLQKERNQAISLLVSAFKKESKKNTVAAKELKEAVEQIATVFYTEKAQQLYELANSVILTDSNLALNQLKEANKIEPENLVIEASNIRLMVGMGDCSGAEKRVGKWLDLINMSEIVALLQSQIKICGGKFEEYRKIRNSIDVKTSSYFQIWQIAEAEVLNKQGQFQKALDLLAETEQAVIDQSSTVHSEIYYWKYKNNLDLKQNSDILGLKYINSCKSISQRSIQLFSFYPFLCKKTVEVESAIKASK